MNTAPIRVLLVEDSPSDAQLLQEYLGLAASERFDVTHVERLDEALSRLSAEAFDVILLDLSLPDSNGHDTFLRAKASAPHTPIVVLSGISDELLGIEAVQHGVQDYLVKSQSDERQITRAIRYAIERSRSEEALARQRRTLDALMAATSDQFYMWDRENRYIYANPAALRTLGRTSEDVLGKTWRDLKLPAEVMEPFEAEIARVFVTGQHCRGELNFPVTHGPHHYEYLVNPIFTAGGRVEAVAISARDITDRKHMDEALRESEERYRQLADKLERLVEKRTADLYRLNRTLEMVSDCNEAIVRARREGDLLADICRITVRVGGYRMAWVGFAQEDPAKTILPVAFDGSENGYLSRMLISWGDGEAGCGPTGTAVRTGKPCIGRDFLKDPPLSPWREEALRCGFGSSIALPLIGGEKTFGSLNIYAAQPDAFGDEQVQVLQELADDVAFGIMALRTRTERDQALRKLERRTSQLRKLASELTLTEERERRRLAQIIHDNLQQLLVGAKISNDALRKRCQTKAQLEVVEQLGEFVKESIDAARSLTFELSTPVLYDVGLAPALEWLGRWMEAKHGLIVAVEADRQAEPENEDVRILLFHATRELLFNVVKHAGVKSAEVQMSRIDGDLVRIAVSDKGVGFEPAKSRIGGLQAGFGLFSIRERLDLLGGRMEVESTPGHGSRFFLLAPQGSAAAKPSKGPHRRKLLLSHKPAIVQKKIRVLLADDHSLIREGLAQLLSEQPDIEVVGEAGDGKEALEVAGRVKPDVVVMDVQMPRMNGIEATAQLTGTFPGVKVIGLSMLDQSESGTAMAEAGAVAYLNKGGPFEALIDAIRKCSTVDKSGTQEKDISKSLA